MARKLSAYTPELTLPDHLIAAPDVNPEAGIDFAPWEAQVHWASSVPDAKVITVAGTTHYVQSQRPDVVVDAIRAIARGRCAPVW